MKIKKIIISAICLALVVPNYCTLLTSALEREETADITNVVPVGAENYAKDRLIPLAKSIESESRFDINISNVDDLEFGTPYVIYSADSLGNQDKIYYFPVLEDENIIMIMSVINNDGEYSASMGKSIADSLNEIDYNNEYVIYQSGQEIVAENEQSTYVLSVSNDILDTDEESVSNALYFESLDYDKKIEKVENTYAKKSKKTTDVVSGLSGARGFSIKDAYQVRLNTNGCLVPQGNLNICWAASAATTIRYLKYDQYKTLTAKQVCDALGVSYTANTIDTQQLALKKYGINYNQKKTNGQVSFAVVQRNILSQNTLLIHAFPSSGDGHAVTIIGYSTYGGVNLITIYNSATNACETVEYKTGGTRFSFNNASHLWKYTLYWKA